MLFNAEKPKRKDKAKPHSRRTRLIFAILLVVLIAGIGGALLVYPRFTPLSDVPKADLLYYQDAQVYAMDFQTGERSKRTTYPQQVMYSAASPDGRFIARWEWVNPNDYTYSHLLVEDTTSQDAPRILGTFYGADATLSWSPDGEWLAFTAYDEELDTSGGGHAAEIWRLHIPTQTLKRLSENTYLDSDPFFSPDGTKIVYMSAADGAPRVYVMDVATGESRLLTPDQYGDNPKWSPDGQWIAFEATYRANDGRGVYTNMPNLYVVRVDGTHGQFVTYGQDQMSSLIEWE